MTTEIAYQILGLENNASTEEVKEAYAKLSKEYHPEENPEEFQRIHEAYVTLTRGGRRRGNRAMVVESSPIEKNSTPEVKESDLVFRNVQKVEVPEVEKEETPELSFGRSIKDAKVQQEKLEEQEQIDFNFDASIQQAQKGEEEQFLLNIQNCIGELETLFSLPNCNDTKKFKEFFGRKEYQKVFFAPVFLHALADYIKKVDLRYGVYSYLIKFYQLKNKKIENLIPEAQRLYRFIDSRYSIKNDVVGSLKSSIVLGGIGGLVYPMVKWGPRIFRQIIKNEIDFDPALLMILVPFVILFIGCVWLYKFFCKKNYVHTAMTKTAGALFFFSLFTYVFEIWAPFFPEAGSGMSEMISSIALALSGGAWLVLKFIFFIAKLMRKEIIEE